MKLQLNTSAFAWKLDDWHDSLIGISLQRRKRCDGWLGMLIKGNVKEDAQKRKGAMRYVGC